MSISAANVAAAAFLLFSGQHTLNSEETAAWKRIRPSVVPIVQNGTVRASGALIDMKGLIIAHRSVVPAPPLYAKLADGRQVPLKEISVDTRTQLVLLQATGWTGGSPVRVMSNGRLDRPLKLLAALPEGAIRANLVTATQMGAINQRMMKLSEIRFEEPPSQVAGAPVFNLAGELVGILGATLENTGTADSALPIPGISLAPPASGTGGGSAKSRAMANQEFGPSGLTVAYSVAPDVLQRVVSGFQSPLHQVSHPALGIMVRDALGNEGVMVNTVVAEGAAKRAGIQSGDIITAINGERIRNRSDYMQALLSQKVGTVIQVEVKRLDQNLSFKVTVGNR